jgi:UDP-N-acetylmuramate: L-alanyl-gamma-D-glutamyl-meso-diaminopimelate ligase
VPQSGRLVVNAREEALGRVLERGCWSDVARFGVRGDVPGFRARGEPHAFDVLKAGVLVGRVEWALLGEHNQMNALAAVAAAEHVGVTPQQACEALGQFANVKRRLELRGEANGVAVYDDFAHHPTAIRTTVDGLRRKVGPTTRILAVFEPRSNTMKLGTMKALLPWSLEEADLSFCHSGGLGWDAVQALAPMGDKVVVADTIDAIVAKVVKAAKPGDQILCMSNGGFGGIHAKLLAALAQA